MRTVIKFLLFLAGVALEFLLIWLGESVYHWITGA